MLPFFIEHYRSRFPDCRIVVYDNESTDRTQQIALEAGCELRINDTGGKLDDMRYLEIKNNCWKETEGWVIVCDCDELLDIDKYSVGNMRLMGNTFFVSAGYNMVNMHNDLNLAGLDHGVRALSYDKLYCFDTRYISETNYEAGCHQARPMGVLRTDNVPVRCYHYKYINPDYMVARHKHFAERLSEVNKQRGFGGHYQYTEAQIRAEFEQARSMAVKIR